MPLLDMIGVDATGSSFCIAFAFLNGKTEEDYNWAFERLRTLYKQCGGVLPFVILTDRYLTAMNTASNLFPLASLLYVWYTNKAVLARYQPTFPQSKV